MKLIVLKNNNVKGGVIAINHTHIDAIVPLSSIQTELWMESGSRFQVSLSFKATLAEIVRQLRPSDNPS